jgi:hypothetical protein
LKPSKLSGVRCQSSATTRGHLSMRLIKQGSTASANSSYGGRSLPHPDVLKRFHARRSRGGRIRIASPAPVGPLRANVRSRRDSGTW